MTICTICDDNKLSEKLICSYCKFQACQNCNRKFIEERPREPLCMNCGKIWTREFILKNIESKQWFFEHIGKFILEKEKMLLPESQEEASNISTIQVLSSRRLQFPTNSKLMRMYKHLGLKAVKDALEEKRELNSRVKTMIRNIKSQTITYGDQVTSTIPKKITRYIFKCPHDCRGFVKDNYECGTCKRFVCKYCNLQLDENDKAHICNKDDIKSASLVFSMTKPCPKCMTLIFKSGGCDQMFCTQCNTAFGWNTGIIESGVIHNPHYYEYLATLSATVPNIDDIACGEIPDAITFLQRIRFFTTSLPCIEKLNKLHRTVSHIRYNVIPNWLVDNVKDNIDIRIKYLLNEFDEETWAKKLMNREKKRMKIKSVYDLLQLILVLMEDFIRKIFVFNVSNNNEYEDNIFKILHENKELLKYYSETLEQIFLVHGGKAPIQLYNFL